MEFKLKFKSLRKSEGYNQKEFGEIFGLTQQSISELESGRKNPSKTLLAFLKYRYSDIFGCPPGQSKSKDQNTPSTVDVVSKHQDLVTRFKNPEKAKEFNEDLLILEEIDIDGFEEVHEIVKRKIERKGGSGNYYAFDSTYTGPERRGKPKPARAKKKAGIKKSGTDD